MELKKYKLGELLDVKRGASLAGDYYATEGELIRLTCGNFDYNNNCFKPNTSKDNIYYNGTVKPEFIMQKDDIITPLTEQAIGLLGSTAKIPESNKYIQSQDVAKIICNEKMLYPDYAFYLISSENVKKQLSAAAQQTKIRHTSPDKIKDCVVWIPDLSAQKKIGDLLSKIDQKIALNRAINQNLEALAKQLYDYWFVQFDFPNEEGKPYKSSGGKMVWSKELKRDIPANWNSSNLIKMKVYNSDYTANGSFAGLGDNVKYNEGEKYAMLIRVVDFNDNFQSPEKFVYINKHGYDYLKSCHLQGGEMIICNVGNAGATYRCPHLDCKMALGPNGILVNNEFFNNFLYMYYSSEIGQQQLKAISSGSIQLKFNKTSFRNMAILNPPNIIIEQFNRIYDKIYEKMNSLWLENRIFRQQRDELLPLLMNGQVTMK
jgi:type I restriction enzyme S subunit